MRRTLFALVVAGVLLLTLAVAHAADDSVAESGVTVGAVTRPNFGSYDYQVMVYTGNGDIVELLTEERTLVEGPVPGLAYLLFDSLDCLDAELDPADLPSRSQFTVQTDPVVLLSSPPKLQAVSEVVADCSTTS